MTAFAGRSLFYGMIATFMLLAFYWWQEKEDLRLDAQETVPIFHQALPIKDVPEQETPQLLEQAQQLWEHHFKDILFLQQNHILAYLQERAGGQFENQALLRDIASYVANLPSTYRESVMRKLYKYDPSEWPEIFPKLQSYDMPKLEKMRMKTQRRFDEHSRGCWGHNCDD